MQAPADAAGTDRGSVIRRLRHQPQRRDELVALLAEQSPIYAALSTAEAERLRGEVLASFEIGGLPDAAMPVVIEQLETGLSPVTVAAAARALRGAAQVPAGIAPLLLTAIERIRHADDTVAFDGDNAAGAHVPVTALTELFRTLAWLGPRAQSVAADVQVMLAQRPALYSAAVRDEMQRALAALSQPAPAPCCCAGTPPAAESAPSLAAAPDDGIAGLPLQDQAGAAFTFRDFFVGRPSVLTFFYTRCMNPAKCSLTVSKLARLQGMIAAAGLQAQFNVAAISYDPAFDLAARLLDYGAARGMTFDDRNRMLRTTGPFEPLQHWLDLGVGYGTSTVNQHRLDVVILDSRMRPFAQLSRLQWREDDVLDALKRARDVA